jgi:hypothetical protein
MQFHVLCLLPLTSSGQCHPTFILCCCVCAAVSVLLCLAEKNPLLQVHMLSINYERAEAAVQSEAHSAVELLQQQLAQLTAERQVADSKLSAAGQALESATSEIEQLTAALQDAELLQQLRRQQELVIEHQQAAVEVRIMLLPLSYCHGMQHCIVGGQQWADLCISIVDTQFGRGPLLLEQALLASGCLPLPK